MLSPCFSEMESDLFERIPNSTNAVESHNRFGKSTHRYISFNDRIVHACTEIAIMKLTV